MIVPVCLQVIKVRGILAWSGMHSIFKYMKTPIQIIQAVFIYFYK